MPPRDAADVAALCRLGHVFAKRRILIGLSQDQVAEAAGVSDRFLRALEGGSGNASYLHLLAIATALGVELEDVIREARTALD